VAYEDVDRVLEMRPPEPWEGITPWPTAKFVLAGVAKCRNRTTGRIDPAIDHLSRLTAFGARTVRRAVRDLENHGLIEVDRSLGGRRRSSRYRLCLPPPNPANESTGVNELDPAIDALNPANRTGNPANQTGNRVQLAGEPVRTSNPTTNPKGSQGEHKNPPSKRESASNIPTAGTNSDGQRETPTNSRRARNGRRLRRSPTDILGPDLFGWFRKLLLPVYPCERPARAAEILAEIDPPPELRRTILADIEARSQSRRWREGYRPSLENYLRERTWEAPYQPKRQDRDEEEPRGLYEPLEDFQPLGGGVAAGVSR
jgi:hypothetical protein